MKIFKDINFKTRIFDLFFSLLGLLILSPLISMVLIILKLSGEREIFYYQERFGRDAKTFKLLKFATMQKNSPNEGAGNLTLPNDPRILPFGRFLRKTKINELPQLINVLKGDMSLIGPRPQVIQVFNLYNEIDKENILKVRPGLSGIGSIMFRNEEEIISKTHDPKFLDEKVIMPYKGKLESWYVANASINIYFFLIFATLISVILPGKVNLFKSFKSLPKPNKALSDFLNTN